MKRSLLVSGFSLATCHIAFGQGPDCQVPYRCDVPCRQPCCAPHVPPEDVADRGAGYVAPAPVGEYSGASDRIGISGLEIRIPEIRFGLPDIKMPGLMAFHREPQLNMDRAVAPLARARVMEFGQLPPEGDVADRPTPTPPPCYTPTPNYCAPPPAPAAAHSDIQRLEQKFAQLQLMIAQMAALQEARLRAQDNSPDPAGAAQTPVEPAAFTWVPLKEEAPAPRTQPTTPGRLADGSLQEDYQQLRGEFERQSQEMQRMRNELAEVQQEYQQMMERQYELARLREEQMRRQPLPQHAQGFAHDPGVTRTAYAEESPAVREDVVYRPARAADHDLRFDGGEYRTPGATTDGVPQSHVAHRQYRPRQAHEAVAEAEETSRPAPVREEQAREAAPKKAGGFRGFLQRFKK